VSAEGFNASDTLVFTLYDMQNPLSLKETDSFTIDLKTPSKIYFIS